MSDHPQAIIPASHQDLFASTALANVAVSHRRMVDQATLLELGVRIEDVPERGAQDGRFGSIDICRGHRLGMIGMSIGRLISEGIFRDACRVWAYSLM